MNKLMESVEGSLEMLTEISNQRCFVNNSSRAVFDSRMVEFEKVAADAERALEEMRLCSASVPTQAVHKEVLAMHRSIAVELESKRKAHVQTAVEALEAAERDELSKLHRANDAAKFALEANQAIDTAMKEKRADFPPLRRFLVLVPTLAPFFNWGLEQNAETDDFSTLVPFAIRELNWKYYAHKDTLQVHCMAHALQIKITELRDQYMPRGAPENSTGLRSRPS